MPGLANTMISPSTPYGEKPVNLTSGGFPSAAYSAVALPTVAIIRMEADGISVLGRATQGVRIMRLAEGAKVISVALTERAETASEGEPEA